MNRNKIRFELFDLAVILVFIGSIVSLFVFTKGHLIISVLLIIISIWMLLILAGRIVAPLYLEGNLIRELIANNGTLPVKILNRQFNYISSFNEHIERLINRDLVEVKDDVVILKNQKYKKGLQNRIMMWGTRKKL